MNHEQLEQQALDNRRRLMKSSIFGNENESFVPALRTAEAPPARRYPEPQPQQQQRILPQHQHVQSSYQPMYTDYQSSHQFQEYHPPKVPHIEEIQMEQSIPALTAFPNYRFDITQPEDSSDLGIQKRSPSAHVIKATKIELHSLGEMQQLRDEMARQGALISEKMKAIITDEPLRINSDQIAQQFQQRNIKPQFGVQDLPEIATRTAFLFPDGTSSQKAITGI